MPLGLVRKEPQLETPARAIVASRVPVLLRTGFCFVRTCSMQALFSDLRIGRFLLLCSGRGKQTRQADNSLQQ